MFTAPAWCGPCKNLGRQLDVLKNRLADNLPIVYVDIDKAQELQSQYGIMSVPKVYLFEEGKPVSEVLGRTALQIEKEVASG